MDAETLGRRIKAARDLAGLSRADLAELVEYHPGEVGRWERGEQEPRQPVIEAIARHTGQPMIFFTEEYAGALAALEQEILGAAQSSQGGAPKRSARPQAPESGV